MSTKINQNHSIYEIKQNNSGFPDFISTLYMNVETTKTNSGRQLSIPEIQQKPEIATHTPQTEVCINQYLASKDITAAFQKFLLGVINDPLHHQNQIYTQNPDFQKSVRNPEFRFMMTDLDCNQTLSHTRAHAWKL